MIDADFEARLRLARDRGELKGEADPTALGMGPLHANRAVGRLPSHNRALREDQSGRGQGLAPERS